MFTGIIEEIGEVSSIQQKGAVKELTVNCSVVLDDLKIGDSVCVDGVCLTAETVSKTEFTTSATLETLNRSTLKEFKAGKKVNLERALPATGRFGGHIVQGHIDSVATIVEDKRDGETLVRSIQVEDSISKYIVEKGSISIDGISLTVAKKIDRKISVAIIPETLKKTTLNLKKVGDKVNIEADIIAKHIEGLIGSSSAGLTITKLKEYGF